MIRQQTAAVTLVGLRLKIDAQPLILVSNNPSAFILTIYFVEIRKIK